MKYILKIITVLIMSSTTTIFYSQGFSFLNTVTSSSSDYQASIRAVKVDQLGNKYIAGNFDISATIKNITITGNSKDIFFGKLDPLGNPIWIKTAGGTDSDQAMDIELDNQGGLYISGLFSSTADFDGNTVTAILPSSNTISMSDNFLVKYDTSGTFQWIKTGATTDNDFNNNVNGYNNNTFNYYGKNKMKFKNGNIYLMASNRVSGSQIGAVNPAGRQFDGITLPNTQAPGGGGTFGYKYLNSFILKTDVNGTNSWLTPIYCNTNQDSDAVIGLDFEVNSNDHVIAQYYYSSNGCKIGGQSTPSSISSFSTPSANFPNGALMILELDGSGFYNNVYKIENALSSYNSFFGFGNALNYISYGLSIDNLNNVYFAFNNYSNGNFNQTIAGINVPENTNTLVKLNPNFVPTNCNLLNTFPSQSQNSFPISAIEIKENQLFFGGTLDGTINLDNSTFSRSDEITFVNMDTNLSSVNWVTSTSNSSVLQVDGSGANTAFPEKYSLGIYDLSIGNENQAVFCGNIGPQYRSFGDYTTITNQLNDAFVTEIIPCSPVFSQILPLNPVICGAGNSATLNANVSPGISYTWVSNGSSTSSSNTPLYTTTNVGDFSLITDSLGCKDTSNIINVTIAPLPNVTVPQSTFTACFSGGQTVVPSGSPAGGIWSGLGMINDSVFDPTVLGPGPSLITYTYTNAQGCSDDGIRIANTVQTPPLILSNNLPSFCEGDGPYSLNAIVNPSGGNYSGPGVSGATFNPNSAGVGTHLIRYKYSVAQNCEDSVDFYFVVNASPIINYPDYDSLCENISSTPLFSASPFGGTYSGPFVISNNFYPFFSGPGSFPITYTITENGCTSFSTKNIQIDADVNAQLNNISDFCINDSKIKLNFGIPSGGIYKIDGVVEDSLKPSLLGIGIHTISYEYLNSCGLSLDSTNFSIFNLPSVNAGVDQAVCDGVAVTLNGSGATTYSWNNGVTDGTAFTPTATSTYTATGTDGNGCIGTDQVLVTVNALPTVTVNDATICAGDPVVTFIATSSTATAWLWSGNGTGNSQTTTGATAGAYSVVVTDVNGCESASASGNLIVNALPTVSAGADQAICDGDAVTLNGSGATTYFWSNGVTDGTAFTPMGTTSYSVIGTDGNGCIGTDSVNVIIIYGSTSTLTVTECDLYNWDGVNYDSTGIFSNVYLGSNGCDSTVTLDLTINNSSTSTLNLTTCDSLLWDGITYDSTGVYTNNYTGSNGCDSTVILNLSIIGNGTIIQISSCDNYIWNGNNYDSTGLYYDTLLSSCLITLDLTINNSSYLTVPFTACDSFLWDGIIYDSTGLYTNYYISANGCDSIVTLDLTINNSTSSTISLIECDSFIWNGVNYDSTGFFTNTYLGSNGCDSTVNLDLIINNSSFITLAVSVCDSFIWDGVIYDSSGMYTNIYIASNGCDSTVILDLTINNRSTSIISVTACDSFVWDGMTYDSTGIFSNIYANVNGCDSVVTLDLTINNSSVLTVKVTECESFFWDGVSYDSTGLYINNYVDANGCDSIVTLDLTINNGSTSTVSVTECDSFVWDGVTYDSTGLYTNFYQGLNGCDSVVTLDLTINNGSTSTVSVTACDLFVLNGITYDSTGMYTNIYQGVNGCDSIVTLDLMIYSVSASIDTTGGDLVASGGLSYLWNTGDTNSTITPNINGLYTVVILDTNGCADTASYNVTYISSTGIWDNSSSSINLYPNPVNDILNISSSDNIKSLEIKDLLGRIIYSSLDINSESISLNTSNFRNNIYLLSLIINDMLVIKKIIISH